MSLTAGPYRYAHGPVVGAAREQARAVRLLGAVAQLVERLLCKEEVRSSSLLGSTADVRVAVEGDFRLSFEVRAGFTPAGGRRRSQQASTVCSIPRTRMCSRASSNERVVHLNK